MVTSLTPREQQVLHEIGGGLTNREIGLRLGIAEKTVKNTVTVVLAKLGLHRRAQAAVYIAVTEATGGRVSMLAG
ncbi:MAG: LuxR C-terminal-related transcriptional regulator [Actinomycetota bacterium]|nr:LuxR C-terminal-related transcriptional regulator [Actinomycetota bacterium]